VTRNAGGAFILTVVATNATTDSTLLVNGVEPRRVRAAVTASNQTTFTAKGKFCAQLPGPIVLRSPAGVNSAPFQCNKTCATQ
jgi:hypothetical protein